MGRDLVDSNWYSRGTGSLFVGWSLSTVRRPSLHLAFVVGLAYCLGAPSSTLAQFGWRGYGGQGYAGQGYGVPGYGLQGYGAPGLGLPGYGGAGYGVYGRAGNYAGPAYPATGYGLPAYGPGQLGAAPYAYGTGPLAPASSATSLADDPSTVLSGSKATAAASPVPRPLTPAEIAERNRRAALARTRANRVERKELVKQQLANQPELTPEQKASGRLGAAKQLLVHGRVDGYARMLSDTSAEYGATRAGAEAAELLADLGFEEDAPTPAEQPTRVVEVVSAAQLKLERGKEQRTVRLIGVSPPAPGAPLSLTAKTFVEEVVRGKKVEVRGAVRDAAGDWAVQVVPHQEQGLSERLLMAGLASYLAEQGAPPEWLALEQQARQSESGIWRQK